jgi:pyridoxal phosphate enzyme (YggS family)
VKDRIEDIQNRIWKAAAACGRDGKDIQLVAVSKTKSAEKVIEAFEAGLTVFGENYVQEAREKFNALYAYPLSWHFIGHLQRNKAKYAVKMFDLIHTVDSEKLAREIDKQAAKIDKNQKVLVQVNIAEEATKSGISSDETLQLIQGMRYLEHISIQGLMTVPPFFNEPEKARPYFRALRQLRDEIQAAHIPDVSMKTLSMGMTGDFEVAIQEGATLVRIGTAIFGERE